MGKMAVPFTRRTNNDGQTILIIAPSGHGKNILLKNPIKQHLSQEYISLFSDSAKIAVDKNDLWYNGPIMETSQSSNMTKNATSKKYIEPIYIIIDDPAMDQSTIKYLSEISRKIRHTKISTILSFQKYSKDISPDLRHNARSIHFSSKCGRALLESIHDSSNLHDTKKSFIEGIHKISERYRFISVDKETADIYNSKPNPCEYRYKLDPKRKSKVSYSKQNSLA